jgi:hypothetical protein
MIYLLEWSYMARVELKRRLHMRKCIPYIFFTAMLCLYWTGTSGAAEWLKLPKWDEGFAEVALYEGEIIKYGISRKSTLEIITVREHFDPQKLVKTRPPKGKKALPVMKTNIVRRVRTGVYEYVQMASVFQNRETGRLIKLSCVSSEWCGNSFALFEDRGDGGTLTISNYMDDKGMSVHKKPAEDALFYEELIPYLRQNLDSLKQGDKLHIIRSLLSNDPNYEKVEAKVKKLETPSVDFGDYGTGRGITLCLGKGCETFLFTNDALRTLLRWDNDRGEYYQLRQKAFLDYWNRNRPGDEAFLQKEVSPK